MSSIADLLDTTNFGGEITERVAGSFVLGTVTANNDKDHKGMVKVSFTAWDSKKNVYEWIPVLTPYGGNEYGIYLQPEIGDVVLVGFIGPGMKRPFVAGSFFSSNSKMLSESSEPKNLKRRLKTKGGIVAELSDEDKKQSITVTTPKAISLVMEDEKETVTIKDKNGDNSLILDCKNGNITVTAKTSITLKSGKCEIKMDGNGGAVSVKCNKLELAATQTAKLEGKQQVTISGGMLSAEGKQTAKLKSSGPTEVSGAIVQIN